MHFVSLELKRAHWAAVAMSKPLAAEYALTPARFDLLYVVLRRLAGSTGQIGIARHLGVSGATVARMLKSLEQLGLVLRETASHDRRCKHIALTERGLTLMRAAAAAIVDGRAVHRIYQRFFGLGEKALAAAARAPTPAAAREAYRAARAKERYDVVYAIEELYSSAAFVVKSVFGFEGETLYRYPLPPG